MKIQGVAQKVAYRIIGPLIVTKIGWCGAKFCLEHYLVAFHPVFVINKQKKCFVTESFKDQLK